MREILFRGKTDKGEWLEGQLLHFKASVGADELAVIVEGCEWDNSNEWFNLGKRGKVIPETVGQYTGLTDKNGKKIFEGDVVNILTENGEIGVIAYYDGGFIVEADTFCVTFQDNINGTELEIIGNIHDNPELLKECEG